MLLLSAWEPVSVCVRPNKLVIDIEKKSRYSMYLIFSLLCASAKQETTHNGIKIFAKLPSKPSSKENTTLSAAVITHKKEFFIIFILRR